MKKALALLLTVATAVSLTACTGGTKTPAPSGSAPAAATGTSDGTLVIASQEFSGVFSPVYYQTAYDKMVVDMTNASLLSFDEKLQPNDEGLSKYYAPEIVKGADGKVEKVVYKYVLKDGLTFSDGKPITTEDVLFSALLQLDPNFNSKLVTFNRIPIIGANEYRYDDPDYAAKLDAIAKEAEAFEPTDEQIKAYAEKQAPVYKVEPAALLRGGANFEDTTLPDMRDEKKSELEAAYIKANLSDGKMDVPEVKGIKVINDKEIHFELSRIDPVALFKLNIEIMPKHYLAPNFKKGDAPEVEKLNGKPMGAGPYKFVEFKNGIVSLVANESYYKGAPKIKNLKFQEVAQANALQVVAAGDVDISEPNANPALVKEVEGHKNVKLELVDNNGYGYIGINAKKVPDKNVRKGLMHLMDRAPAIQSYYGDLATVIERPLSTVSWAYPTGATEFYGYSPEKAMAKFKEAGYEQVDGKLVKNGKQLKILIGIPGDGAGNHPSYAIVNKMKTEGEKLGILIDIRDLTGAAYWTAMEAEEFDLFCAAWGGSADPDMTQLYHSKGPSNIGRYNLNNPELDKLIEAGVQTLDINERKEIYKKALDIVMEEAVEMPVYQRKNAFCFNREHLNLDTLPERLTPFQGPTAHVETLELVK